MHSKSKSHKSVANSGEICVTTHKSISEREVQKPSPESEGEPISPKYHTKVPKPAKFSPQVDSKGRHGRAAAVAELVRSKKRAKLIGLKASTYIAASIRISLGRLTETRLPPPSTLSIIPRSPSDTNDDKPPLLLDRCRARKKRNPRKDTIIFFFFIIVRDTYVIFRFPGARDLDFSSRPLIQSGKQTLQKQDRWYR